MAVDFIEIVDSRAPGNFGFSIEGGRATLVIDVLNTELEDAITELLGACVASGLGGLNRKLPKAHPSFPWLFCERISNIQGLKPFTVRSESEFPLEAPALDFWQDYEKYRLTCEFMPRPYALISDASLVSEVITTYDDAGASSLISCPNEWTRFVDIQTDAKPELITAQQGQMVFYTNGAVAPDGETFPSYPRIYIQNGQVRLRWFQVPERYVRSRSSNLKKYIGRVNQTAFLEWEAGELLYLGFTQKRYVPPFPARIGDANEPTSFSTAKLVDLELVFDETVRTAGTAYTPTNLNWVANGHNLQPYLKTRKFYFAASATATPASSTPAAERFPTFLSFETRLLFKDPDV